MDWGLARVASTTDRYGDDYDDEMDIEAVETARTSAGLETQAGSIKGTLPYMSPEQLLARELDRRSDIYALGCLLYEMLCLLPAFDPSDGDLIVKKQTGDIADVRTRNARRKVPEPLATICEKALQADPEQRYQMADELADDLRRWLDGRSERQRRHEEAERLAAEGKQATQRYLELRDEIKRAEDAADAEVKEYKPYQPVSEKRPMIEARERVEQLKVDLALAFAECQKLLDAALLRESDNKSARAELAHIWADRLTDAERRRHRVDTAYAKVMIERYVDEPLVEEGRLTVTSNAPAEVTIARYEEIDGVQTPVNERFLGTTPVEASLPSGSYLCVLKADGKRDTRYPVLIERGQTWRGEVGLKSDEEIGDGFVHVPAGKFIYGKGKETTTKELPDFAMAKYPVTFGEYLEFLSILDEEEAERRKPQTPGDGPCVEKVDGVWRVLPILVEGPAREWCEKHHGEGFDLRCPVIGIDYDDAEAFCNWKGEATGQEWRLPTEEEREKAGRGVDGRRFAWGDLEDASLGKCRESREVPTQPEPVGAFATAESVYGMGDASGGAWDWTSSWEDERRSSRVLRGGSWNAQPSFLRCAVRTTYLPRARSTDVGVRCARGLPPSHA